MQGPNYKGQQIFVWPPDLELKMLTEEHAGDVSDGYHSFRELYEVRRLLYMGFLRGDARAWKSKTHWIDGKLEPCWHGWFLAGTEVWVKDLPGDKTSSGVWKQISFHLPLEDWDICPGREKEKAPEWDGHTSADVVERLRGWLR